MADELDDIFGSDWSPAAVIDEEGDGSFEPLPPGTYRAQVDDASLVTTKAGNGKMIKVTLKITGPTHAGRLAWDQMVVAHPNATASSIGQLRFASLCVACGFEAKRPRLHELIGRPISVRLGIEKSEQYGDRNKVTEYRPGSAAPPSPHVDSFDDSEIPF